MKMPSSCEVMRTVSVGDSVSAMRDAISGDAIGRNGEAANCGTTGIGTGGRRLAAATRLDKVYEDASTPYRDPMRGTEAATAWIRASIGTPP